MSRILPRSLHARVVGGVVLLALLLTALVGDHRADAIGEGVPVVFVSDGVGYADALVGATLAAAHNAPLLTVANPRDGDLVPQETADELERLQPQSIVILGGTAAVSDEVARELATFTSGEVTRVKGASRFGTAAAISQALPAKVGDADRLDGMDSSEFLPATGKAADADLLDGVDGAEFARRRWAVVGADGTLQRGHGVASTSKLPTALGEYEVVFDRDLRDCAFVATIGSTSDDSNLPESGEVLVTGRAGNEAGVFVDTRASDGTDADRPFHLIVMC